MTTAQQLYALNLDQASALIGAVGKQRTVLVQGEMGTGKTTLLKTLSKQLPNHTACYFDATTKDVGDITIPNVMRLDDSEMPDLVLRGIRVSDIIDIANNVPEDRIDKISCFLAAESFDEFYTFVYCS